MGSLGRPLLGCSANYVSKMKQPTEIGQHEELWSESNGLQCASFRILWQHSIGHMDTLVIRAVRGKKG